MYDPPPPVQVFDCARNPPQVSVLHRGATYLLRPERLITCYFGLSTLKKGWKVWSPVILVSTLFGILYITSFYIEKNSCTLI